MGHKVFTYKLQVYLFGNPPENIIRKKRVKKSKEIWKVERE